MRFPGAAGVAALALGLAGCAPGAGGVLRDLYGGAPPANVRVVHFQADTLGMDPSFAWELAPIDEGYLRKLVEGNGLIAPPEGESIPSSGYGWPAWWDAGRIEALPERHHNDASGLRRIYVDRENDRIYVEFVGT